MAPTEEFLAEQPSVLETTEAGRVVRTLFDGFQPLPRGAHSRGDEDWATACITVQPPGMDVVLPAMRVDAVHRGCVDRSTMLQLDSNWNP